MVNRREAYSPYDAQRVLSETRLLDLSSESALDQAIMLYENAEQAGAFDAASKEQLQEMKGILDNIVRGSQGLLRGMRKTGPGVSPEETSSYISLEATAESAARIANLVRDKIASAPEREALHEQEMAQPSVESADAEAYQRQIQDAVDMAEVYVEEVARELQFAPDGSGKFAQLFDTQRFREWSALASSSGNPEQQKLWGLLSQIADMITDSKHAARTASIHRGMDYSTANQPAANTAPDQRNIPTQLVAPTKPERAWFDPRGWVGR